VRPYENAESLSVLIVGSSVSPGVVTIQGIEDAENWNIKAAKGSTGASTTLEGKPPKEFTTEIYLADDSPEGEEFDRWETFRAIVEATTAGAKPAPVPVYHYDLAAAGITEAAKKSIKGPVYDGRGGATYTIDWIEYKPPAPKPPATPRATARGRGATGAGAQGARAQGVNPGQPKSDYDPNAAAKRELEGLLAEARKPV